MLDCVHWFLLLLASKCYSYLWKQSACDSFIVGLRHHHSGKREDLGCLIQGLSFLLLFFYLFVFFWGNIIYWDIWDGLQILVLNSPSKFASCLSDSWFHVYNIHLKATHDEPLKYWFNSIYFCPVFFFVPSIFSRITTNFPKMVTSWYLSHDNHKIPNIYFACLIIQKIIQKSSFLCLNVHTMYCYRKTFSL